MDTQTKQAKYMARFGQKTRSHEPPRRHTEIAPGHAKTKQAAYMVTSREKAKQARSRVKEPAARIKTSKKEGKSMGLLQRKRKCPRKSDYEEHGQRNGHT